MQQETSNNKQKLKRTLKERFLTWTRSALSTSSMLLTLLITASLALHAAWPHKTCSYRSNRCTTIASPTHKGTEGLVSKCRFSAQHSEVESASDLGDRCEQARLGPVGGACKTGRGFTRVAVGYDETQSQPSYNRNATADMVKPAPGAAIIERNRKATAPLTPLHTGAKREHGNSENKNKAPESKKNRD